MYPFQIVDNGDKIEEYLTKDRLGLFIGANGGDDCVHINTEAGEIHQILHGSNARDDCLSFHLVGVSKIHNILGCSFHFINQLAVDKTFIPLRKEHGWLNRICLEFEAEDFLCSKIPLKDLRSKGLRDDSDQD
jgi:hypothetical protein